MRKPLDTTELSIISRGYILVRLEGFEPPIDEFVVRSSIQLSHRRKLTALGQSPYANIKQITRVDSVKITIYAIPNHYCKTPLRIQSRAFIQKTTRPKKPTKRPTLIFS